MNLKLQFVLFSLSASASLCAQVVPAATSPGVPIPPGNLSYSVRYAQSASFEGSLGNWQTSTLAGSLDYSNSSNRLPFRLNYGGGYNWTISGPAFNDGFFQRFLVSQGITGRRWGASVSDDVGYSPQAPTLGFSGIPGIGEPIAGQGAAPPQANESILTVNTHVLDNGLNGQFTRNMSASLLLNLGGGYTIMRFPDGNGLDTNGEMADGGIRWRLDARDSLTSDYTFSQFTYPAYNLSFRTQAAVFGMQRAWNRSLTTTAAAGPQWIASSETALIPPSTGVSANASVNYRFGFSSAAAAYSHGVNSGAGYLTGAEVDTASASYSYQLDKSTDFGLTASYSRSAQLGQGGIVNARYGGVQMTHRLSQFLTVFANYTAETQSASASLPGNTLSQLIQVLGFGIGYSPRQISLRPGR